MSHDVKSRQNELMPRNERRKLKTKEKVRKAAVETFLELGYLKATVQDIMTRADLGYGTFYKYYESKQDLIVEIATEALEMITKNYKKPPANERIIYERVLYSYNNIVQTIFKHRDILRILRDWYIIDEKLRKLWESFCGEPFDRLKRDMKWSMRRGLCREVDLETAMVVLGGHIQAVINYVLDNNLSAQHLTKLEKDVALLYTKAVFAVEEIPVELLAQLKDV